MKKDELKKLLDKVKTGEIDIDNALAQLEDLPFKDLGFAKLTITGRYGLVILKLCFVPAKL